MPILALLEDEMAKFKAGDVVRLNSGGPKMTIVLVNQSGRLDCNWFGNQLENHFHSVFVPEALTLVIEQPTSD